MEKDPQCFPPVDTHYEVSVVGLIRVRVHQDLQIIKVQTFVVLDDRLRPNFVLFLIRRIRGKVGLKRYAGRRRRNDVERHDAEKRGRFLF